MRSRSLLFVSAAASAVYLLTQHWRPYPGSPLIKGCAVGALALFAFGWRKEKRDAALLSLGLAFSTAGDVVLDLGEQFFVFGLLAFLFAHISYITLFVRNRRSKVTVGAPGVVAVALVVAYSASLSAWIVPAVGGLAGPVVFYICAITSMVSAAILGRFASRWVAVGALLFLISDSLLAIHKFKTPVPMRDTLVGLTYYLGQCGIALGYLAGAGSR